MLERYEMSDLSTPGLLELTSGGHYNMTTRSGLNDYDYQGLASLSLGHKPLQQVQTVSKIPIPSEILEYFKYAKCYCMMGLFPEIGRAWLTIDTQIYIWTYEQARDVSYYDGLSHVILAVGLVKPKPNVFIDDVKYLLILTTSVEILILGVTFENSTKVASSPMYNVHSVAAFEELQLMEKPIFILSTDNVHFNVVKGSDNGRIFLGGNNGSLYEITYQGESSWLGKRCRKVNHSRGIVSYVMPNVFKMFSEEDPIMKICIDNDRQLLYLLTEKGSIEAWEIDIDGKMRQIHRVTQNHIVSIASETLRTVDSSIFKSVKSICPILAEDCPDLHLLAITQSGVRLYFATTLLTEGLNTSGVLQNLNQMYPLSQSKFTYPKTDQGKGLYLVHIRLPPGYTPNTKTNRPRNVNAAYFDNGTLLLVSKPQQEQDLLWSISSAPYPNHQYLAESTTILQLDGSAWSLDEVHEHNKGRLQSLLRKAQIPKKIAILTNQGIHILALLKPVDLLKQLLLSCNGPHHDAVKAFFQAQTQREACITCLLLSCSDQYRCTDLSLWAAQAFMLYGGGPHFRNQLPATGRVSPTQQRQVDSPHMFMSTPLPNYVGAPISRSLQPTPTTIQQPHQPLSPLSPINQTTHVVSNEIVYSAKHDGLYIYVARLLRPLWKMRCITGNFTSSLTERDCVLVLDDLRAIKTFLETNSINELSSTLHCYNNQVVTSNGFTNMLHNSNIPMNEQRKAIEQAQTEEKRSLTALSFFIKRAFEVLALWKILCEHEFHILIKSLTKDQQAILTSCTFSDLALSRVDSCSVLIIALINSYLKDNASVNSISTKLRDSCPSLYRHEDAVTYKATEILMTSRTCQNPLEKDEKLRLALKLCKDAAPNIPLQNICQQFTVAEFYEGVIELSVICAAKIDPEEFGIHYYSKNEQPEDREGYAGYAARMTCYKEVREKFDYIYQTIMNATAKNEMSHQTINTRNYDENENIKIMEIVIKAVQFKDPLLHVAVYEWLLSHDMFSELLTLTEPSLGIFLQRSVLRTPDNFILIDLLWKYYEKNSHHAQAAKILDNLASNQNEAIELERRIEYLARAVMCMRNDVVGISSGNGVLLKELEDKLEVARIQKLVLATLSELSSSNNDAAKAVRDLNCSLYDITQLYHNFADPFNLWECKLTILNCSHHNDPLLIESVWGAIISKATECPGTVHERSTRLFTKIELLVKDFGDSGHCFPLAFLIRALEIKACQLELAEGIVPEKLLNMNIDLELLLEYYSRMISMNERVWANEGNEWHLVQSWIRLVTLLANNAHNINVRSKRRIVGKAQDILSICLNLCYQKPGTERLQQSLKELQCRLQRNIG